MDVQGYQWVRWRLWLCRLVVLLSLGILQLIFHWQPRLGILARCRSCSLAVADILLLKDVGGFHHVVEVLTEEMEDGSLEMLTDLEVPEWRDSVQLYKEEKTLLRYYLFEGLRYIWLGKKGAFCPVSVLNENWTRRDLYSFQTGLSHEEQCFRRRIYGPNIIDVPVKSYLKLLFEEILNPFYVFQVFSFVVWISEEYVFYAIAIIFLSVFSLSLSLYETRKQSITLHNMAQLVTTVTVRRSSGAEEIVSSEELVPGDCIVIPREGMLLPCDAAVFAGECLVNESMLTGESVPVLKTPLPGGEEKYSSERDHRHTLFCGTQLIQAKGRVPNGGGAVAVVTSTGFFTTKGNLVSSIMYPQHLNFRFYQDAMKFLLVMGFVALIGTIYSIIIFFRAKVPVSLFVFKCLDVVTIVVSPALPALITMGTIYSQQRLKKVGILCISPPRINVSGKVSVFCFDKTGTLTEDGLDVWGVMEGGPAGFSHLVPEPRHLAPGPMLSGLACCHTVTLLRGQPIGDPLELKMLESTGWTHHEPEGYGRDMEEFGGHRVLAVMRPPAEHFQDHNSSSSEPMALVQRFPFSSALQRMSVVTVARGGQAAIAFMKGSPEMVASLCREDTVPKQFSTQLRSFSSEGLRVLALAYKPVEPNTDWKEIQREEVEKDLHFLGLLIMKNLVKPVSADVINQLRLAKLRTVMVTGDNILTAVSVAKTCGMVGAEENVTFVKAAPPTAGSMPTLQFSRTEEERDKISMQIDNGSSPSQDRNCRLAISGKSFAVLCDHFRECLPKILMQATVFARMSPDQKTQLVKELQALDYRVGMCGDGANDCGALRASDVGISLSEAEASVASPFTSKIQNISCVPLLIREGRCSLVTSFSLFKFLAISSLIQFSCILILYSVMTTMADLQYLILDLFLATALALLMGRGGPSDQLHPRRPGSSLMTLAVVASLLIHTCMFFLGQLSVYFLTTSQDWHIPFNSTYFGATNLPNVENTSLFFMSSLQYIIIAVVVTKGFPHKKPMFYNVFFFSAVIVLFVLMTSLLLFPGPFFAYWLELYNITDMGFKLLILVLAALNFFVCLILEMLIDKGMLNCFRRLCWKRLPKKQFKRLDALPHDSPSWPPIGQTLDPADHTVIHLS